MNYQLKINNDSNTMELGLVFIGITIGLLFGLGHGSATKFPGTNISEHYYIDT